MHRFSAFITEKLGNTTDQVTFCCRLANLLGETGAKIGQQGLCGKGQNSSNYIITQDVGGPALGKAILLKQMLQSGNL